MTAQDKNKKKSGFLRRLGAQLSLTAAFMAAAAPAPALAAGPTSAAIVVNANTRNVIYARNSEASVYPASTTKLMTAYLTFDALKSGRLRLDQRIPVSRNAASQPTTNLGMMSYSTRRVPNGTYKNKKGRTVQRYRTVTTSSQNTTTITVENALKGLMVHSGNDAAVVLAEALGGSTSGFATQMNSKARQLGMTNTNFVNPNGLPSTAQHTTARDMTRLMGAIIKDHPRYYDQFLSVRHFSFNGGSWSNTNKLLDSSAVPGVDGGKTGYIRASGFNIVMSAQRNGERVIVGVFGGSSGATRNALAGNLTNFGFFKIVRDANATFDPARTYEAVSPAPRAVTPQAPLVTPQSVSPMSWNFNYYTMPGSNPLAPRGNIVEGDLPFFSVPLMPPAAPAPAVQQPQDSATPTEIGFSTGPVKYRFSYRFT